MTVVIIYFWDNSIDHHLAVISEEDVSALMWLPVNQRCVGRHS